MTKGEKEYAIRMALNSFDKWNDITGYFDKGTSYYYEIQGEIENAVKIGIKVSLYGMKADLKNLDESDE